MTASEHKKGQPVVKVENLALAYETRYGDVNAVRDVSFEVYRGETLGIVGESGSGKSVTAWSILGLVPQPAGSLAGASFSAVKTCWRKRMPR